jgi:beta-glucanase (GH16 family)
MSGGVWMSRPGAVRLSRRALLGGAGAAALPRADLIPSFRDDFKTLSLYDPGTRQGRWKTTYDWGQGARYMHDEMQVYVDPAYNGINPFRLTADGVEIIAARNPHPDDPKSFGKPYTSGLLTTSPSFTQQYGYFEIEATLPDGAGLWPAFWLAAPIDLSNPKPQYLGEIDVLEMIGREAHTLYLSVHYPVDTAGTASRMRQLSAPIRQPTERHRYGTLWTADTLTWYLDGRVIGEMGNPGVHRAMMLLINLGVGGRWGGPPTPATHFPAVMKVHAIGAYRLRNAAR